jgi:hypothetical protein
MKMKSMDSIYLIDTRLHNLADFLSFVDSVILVLWNVFIWMCFLSELAEDILSPVQIL